MGWGRVGRTIKASAVVVPLVTGAYAALDCIGSAFEIAEAIGDKGSVVTQLEVFDRGSAMSGFRVHFFCGPPAVIADNAPFTIPSGTENNHLGFIEVASTDWVTAGISGGNTAMQARIINQNIGLYNNSGVNRSVWCNVQSLNNQTFGGLNSAQTVRLVTLQD